MDDDRALWTASLGGDGDAFGILFDRHQARVYRHALRLVPATSDAEDVTASSFLELWRRRNDVRLTSDSTLPWLLVTATNMSRNLQRSTRRHRDLLQQLRENCGGDRIVHVTVAGADVQIEDDQLHAALRSLKEVDLQLVTLVVLEGFSLEAAGQLLGLTPGAAKTRMHRARNRLRSALAGHPAAHRTLTSGRQRP